MSTASLDIDALWSKARPDSQGLLTCAVQDLKTRRVLMVAWVSKEALLRSLETGWATFWSRSRRELWEKGATSGHRQRLLHVRLDCDGDTLLYTVEALGPACHEGYDTCFTWRRVGNGWRRDAEPIDYPQAEGLKPLAEDLGGVLDVPLPRVESEPESRPASLATFKAIRIGAPIEAKARALATSLQLKQKDRLAGAAAELVAETLRALAAQGVQPADVRAVLDAAAPTTREAPADPDPSP